MKMAFGELIVMLLLTLAANEGRAQYPSTPLEGKEVFIKYCVRCHGKDGTKGLFGAKNLQTSKLSDADMLNIISNGKRIMPSWKKKLTPDEISLVMGFVKSLRYLKQD